MWDRVYLIHLVSNATPSPLQQEILTRLQDTTGFVIYELEHVEYIVGLSKEQDRIEQEALT